MKNLLVLLFSVSALITKAQSNDSTVYELRIYKIAEGKREGFVNLFQNQIGKLIIKHHMKPFGFWIDADSNKVIYIVSHTGKIAMASAWKNFYSDPAWKPIKEKLEANGKTILKTTSVPMRYSDIVLMNTATNEQMLYELRIYTCLPNRLPNLITRFKTKTTRLFEKHDMKNIVYWTTIEKSNQPKLVYIVTHKDKATQKTNWDSFRNDPDWISARDQSEKDGKIVERIESISMTPFTISSN